MTLPEGAELGSTKDPKALIKGEPSQVTANAQRFSDEATTISESACAFGSVRMDGWEGGFGQPAFTSARADEQGKWTAYTSLLTTAGQALDGYAGAVTTAQDKAQDAIDKWEEGERASERAVTAYNNLVEAYNSHSSEVRVPAFGGGGGGLPSAGPPHPGVFVDPGVALEEEAQQILKDAREALDEAGMTAVQTLAGMRGAKTEGSSGPDASFDAKGPKFSWKSWEKEFGDQTGKPGEQDSPFELKLGEIDAKARAWGAKGTWEDYLGGVKVNADGEVKVLAAEGGAEASLGGDGLKIGADAKVLVVGADGSLKGELGPAEIGAKGEIEVGASAEGGLTIGGSGISTENEVFAGAKAAAGIEGDVGGIGGAAGVEGWAGFGASVDVGATAENGKLTLDAGAGAAFLLGGKADVEVTVDPGKVIDTVGDVADFVGGLGG